MNPPCPLPLPPTGQTGFTLIEMLVVLTLVALLSIVAVGQLGRRPDFVSRATALTTLRGRVTDARHRAAVEGIPVEITIPSLGPNLTYQPALSTHGSENLTIFADGSTSGGALFVDQRRVATINWLTGEVRDVTH